MIRMQSVILSSLLVFAIIFSSFGQGGGNSNNNECKNFLDMLNKKIERVKEVVTKSNNAEAQKVLDEAIALKDEAVKLLADNKPVEAKEKAKEAMKLLAKALSLANGNNCNNGCENFLKNLAEKIAKAEVLINASKNDEAIKLLAEAKLKYEKAMVLFKEGKTKEAMQEGQAAFKLLSQALRLINKGCCDKDQMCNNMEKMAVEKVADAKAAIDANPTGSKITEATAAYTEAQTHLTTGQTLKAAGKTAEAMVEFRTAKQLAMKAIMLAKIK
ncbi:MAG: hypothetical protein JW795_22455 [Chitinivibrionales bacterium]|nr:hypothetical protein [Chitinivibrionales bacterium]